MRYNPNGLTQEQVERSRAEKGENVLTPVKDNSAWKLFIEKFEDPIIQVLLFAAALSLVVGIIQKDLTESIGIIGAILLATLVGFWFEWDAQRRFRRLNSVNDEEPVKVIRDGQRLEIPRREVVVGDVVIIENGETIPADGRLVEAVSLVVNESTLTGEPETTKTTDPKAFNNEATYPSNEVLRGTTVVDGYGTMVVTAVGDRSEAGRVTEQATVTSGQRTPLNRQLNRLSKLIGKIGFILSGAIMAILLLKAIFLGDLFAQAPLQIFETVLHIFMLSVAIIVMAVPEGLPMAITLSLAMSMRRMLKTNNLVRKMHACETMGAVTVICTDKTGTLTQNRMRVGEMILCQGVAQCPAPHDELARQIALNSTAFLDKDNRVLGNSTEGALLLWIKDNSDLDYQTLRDRVHIRARQTFSTETKYMATITEHRKHKNRRLLVKGAPEIVLGMCRNVENEEEIRSRLLAFQERGMRTLALAMAVPETDIISEEIARRELTLSAIVAISDPVREDVPAAVQECLDAGIKVKIVTGDTAATAREIARQIGLWNDEVDGPTSLMTGDEFAAMSDEELLERVTTLKILSRARPLDKQRLVRLLQRKNEVVAVTGDGTNDAPALNFANVGLSMGSGTSVAKEASDITLLDDSFKSIATAVMWGRSLYRNIQRFVLFQLTINVVAIVICFVGAIIESVIPLTVPQILWVNIIMDTFAAMAFSSLPPSKEVMQERPRRHSDFIVSKNMAGMIFGIGGVMVAVLLAMLLHWEVPTLPQLTYFFSIFIFMQFWNMLNAKAFESGHSGFTHWKGCGEFVAIMGLIALGQYIIVELGGDIFRTEPLMALEWVLVIVPTMLIAVGGNLIIYLFRRYKR